MLIIVCGLPGSGKTTLAGELAKMFSAVRISSDIVRRRMFPSPEYTDAEKEAVYGRMAEEASGALREGKIVVVDATFYKAGERARFMALAREAGAKAKIVLCRVGEEEARRRLDGRRGGASDADYPVYLKVRASFEPITEEHIEVDCSIPLRGRLREVEEFLR